MNRATNRHFIEVDLGERSYQIIIGEEIIVEASQLIAPLQLGNKKIIVTDQNLASTHLSSLREALVDGGNETAEIVLKSGEKKI